VPVGRLVALGLIATATRVVSAFYVFGLALLPKLALIGGILLCDSMVRE
jgi:hypothetical protein